MSLSGTPLITKKVIPGRTTVTISWSDEGPGRLRGHIRVGADLLWGQRHLLMHYKALILYVVTRKVFARVTENWSHESREFCFLVLNSACNYRHTHRHVYWFSVIRFLADGASKGAWNDKDKISSWSTHPYAFFPLWRCLIFSTVSISFVE